MSRAASVRAGVVGLCAVFCLPQLIPGAGATAVTPVSADATIPADENKTGNEPSAAENETGDGVYAVIDAGPTGVAVVKPDEDGAGDEVVRVTASGVTIGDAEKETPPPSTRGIA